MKIAERPRSRQQKQAHKHWEQGVAWARQKRWPQALQAFEQALASQPDDVLVLVNAARAAQECQQLQQALQHLDHALSVEPGSDLAQQLKMVVLQKMQRHAEVLQFLDSGSVTQRQTLEWWRARADAMLNLGRHKEAIEAFMEALSHKLDDAELHYRMGVSFYEMQLKEEAAECFRTALLLGLGKAALHVHGMLAYAERENCRWPQADAELARMRELVEQTDVHERVMTLPFAHITLTDDPLYQLRACRLMANNFNVFKPVRRTPRKVNDGRIRIGYVSADFHQHATAVLMCEVFEQTDRSKFDVYMYSHGVDDKSPMRERLKRAAEHFIDLRGKPDQEIAERIAEDDIDILVDLKGYTAENRIGVFGRRPAPIQVAYIGFPGTTGADFMDYLVGDPIVTPMDHAAHFSEKIAQLPICYQPNDRHRPLPRPTTRTKAGLPEDAVVLCGFNQAYKISAEVLDVWASLLVDIPNSVLWLLDWHGQARPHLEAEMQARGMDMHRVRWAPRLALEHHLDRLALADIFIDTWPCNAHTTASDALWAGVPVVTYTGQTFASRVAASLLNAVGMSELACGDLDTYRATVRKLAMDPERLRALRAQLQRARTEAPLFDTPSYTRALESLFTRMVERHRQGLPLAHLAASTAPHHPLDNA